MSNRVKKIYKCKECETMITIVTKVHELPESIICPCDSVAENQGSKWKSLTTKCLSTRSKEQLRIRKEYRPNHTYQSLSSNKKGSEKKLFLDHYAQSLTRTGEICGRSRRSKQNIKRTKALHY